MDGVQRTFEIFKIFNIKDGKDIKIIYLKSKACLLTDVFENFIKISIEEQ